MQTIQKFDGKFVTVETDDDLFVGVLGITGNSLTVQTGRRGRPVILDDSDVIEVLLVNSTNPHIAR